MKDLIAGLIAGSGAVMLGVALVIIGPVCLLWSVNSLASAGGADFYIQHNAWNYLVAVMFLICVRGGSK